ncbi:MAG: glycine cleavage system aminomethyltransferase GcvT [candidate division KSB1 bacterium]|nr:glycine cleavage system aminomethyltransferase GcvT [candidate division KSB1 bacterium]MDZ7276493.1 glycine cleavage system aminomethyltransferase GcvT [candidate division KSB1 bacterium]MDZ7286726.1 glycine cleavage system aminomethyltransferase GcvT [candidate division KSB1 bacterium]MDZ7300263.1 glycine cleavage system aminomethyltransferase GcvT [candidate division KSB1 bacterium]MDZ7308582.1 glycine cleavage system aminomethyltransferase GcvT [candidate division KSB1 bacterium]
MANTRSVFTAKKTPLHEVHVGLGAKMVEFGGYLMPVQYRGIIEEHLTVRRAVGVFDVSHMGEFEFRGPGAPALLQRMTINDVARLAPGQAQYSAMCYPDGGIVDDLIVYRLPDRYLAVVNAANLRKDWEWLQQEARPEAGMVDVSEQTALLAVQGRHARATLQKLTTAPLHAIKSYWLASGEIAGVPALIARTGYTGEDGFELACDARQAVKLWDALFEAGREFGIEPIGLGARDTLRLEMKYCLYGNDIDHTTNPLEAGLGWITKLDKGDFIGRAALASVKAQGLRRKLVGLELSGRNLARHGHAILKDGVTIGHVTSGTFSPSLQKAIAMGYVAAEHSAVGTELTVDVRGRQVAARVVATPFYRRDY